MLYISTTYNKQVYSICIYIYMHVYECMDVHTHTHILFCSESVLKHLPTHLPAILQDLELLLCRETVVLFES